MKKRNLKIIILALSTLLLFSCELGKDRPSITIRLMSLALDYTGVLDGHTLSGTINDQAGMRMQLQALADKAGYKFEEYYLTNKESKAFINSDEGITMGPAFSFKEYVKNQLGSIWKSEATETDITVFYYSGHGSGSDCNKGALAIGKGYSDENQNSYITPGELRSYLKDIPGKKLIILDSCYSGLVNSASSAMVSTSDLFNTGWNALFKGSDGNSDRIWSLSAAKENESSYDDTDGYPSYGFFTKALLEGLGYDTRNRMSTNDIPIAKNDDGAISVLGMLAYAKENLSSETPQIPCMTTSLVDLILFLL